MPAKRLKFERALLDKGIARIAGVDEAGRGPLAGPVVAAAVMMPREWIESAWPKALAGLNDSKQLTAAQRETYFEFLTQCELVQFGVAMMTAAVIDEINILQATHRAMNEALSQLAPSPEHVLVDGLRVNSLTYPQTAIVKGDALSYSIAAASVIAKVTRDRFMLEIDREFPQYGFAGHKGYATQQHLEMLARHGPCAIHRRSFAPIKQPEPELFPEFTSVRSAPD